MKKLLYSLCLIVFAGFVSCDTASKALEVKLISYNIRLSASAAVDDENCWENRKQATLNMIEKEAPTVFGLQEAMSDQIQFLDQNLPQFNRIGVGRDDGKEAGEFMAVYYLKSQFDLLDSATFWLSETPKEVSKGWDAACYRTLTWVKLRDIKTKKIFHFFNTHFDHQGMTARTESAKLVVRLIKDLAKEGENVVFGGDLNLPTSQPILNPIKEYMTDARDCSPISDSLPTFNGFATADGEPIDHIYAKNVECISFRTLIGDYGVPYISDHYPIEFVFKVSK